MQEKVLVRIFRNKEFFDFHNIEDIPEIIYNSISKVFNIEDILKITINYDTCFHGGIAVGVVEFDGNILIKWSSIPDDISQLGDINHWEVDSIW